MLLEVYESLIRNKFIKEYNKRLEKTIKHKDLNSRVLCFFKKGVGSYDFEKALYCPSVMRHGLKETSNEDLFKLWGIPNPLSIVKP